MLKLSKMWEITENEQQISDPIESAWDMKVPEFRREDNPHRLLEVSSLATSFLKCREQYLRESWPLVEKLLATHFIKAEIDLNKCTMTVRTTEETWDPSIILKARDLMRLLAESVPFEHAQRVLEDDIACDVIEIGSLAKKRENFLKRRQRIIGPNGCTLKSIELLTKCCVFVQDQTVVAMGPYRGLVLVRRIVTNTMRNPHRVYNIKSMMIHLDKDPMLTNADLGNLLLKYTSKKHKAAKEHVKKYTSNPQSIQDQSKVDAQLASGMYVVKEHKQHAKKRKERGEEQKEAFKIKQEKRQRLFISAQESTVYVHNKGPESSAIKAIKRKAKMVQKRKN